jgi:peroxiredoxin
MKGFQAGIQKYADADAQVIGISVDAAPSLGVFAKQLDLQFPLVSDFPAKKTARDYGTLIEERGFASRTSFVIDKEGKIVEIVFDPKPGPHNEVTLEACSRLKGKH